ncbi:MAG: CPBP family intramembrane metalloprotease [Candidatus Lokiarchaeota archaeon]|nr:CPBP family intramembrane metalloprotease [Candidatus Lokiarchaeota archaeon]
MVFSVEKKRIAKVRFTFFLYEIALVFVFLFALLIVPVFLLPLIAEEGSNLYGILFYLIRAIIVFLGIPLILYLTNLLFESQKKIILEEDISPSTGHLKLFRVTKKNYKYQILYGFAIFFLVFLPLDFFTYLIPGSIAFQSFVLGIRSTNFYLSPLSDNYFIFLISAIIIQFSVAVTEETVTRGFLAKRGSEYFFPMSAVIISSLYFGLGHLAYLLDAVAWYPVILFMETFIVGIILALFVLRKKWILPVIIAHALNNIVSAHTIWSFWQGISFQIIIFFVYIPLFIIGVLFVTVCLLLVWDFSSFREGLSNGFSMFKTYFKRDSGELKRDSKEITTGDTFFRIIIDIIIAILIFLMGLLIAI